MVAADPRGQASAMCMAMPKQARSLEELAKTMVANWKGQIPEWKEVRRQELKVSGRPALHIRGTGKPGGNELLADYFLVLTERHQLLLMLSCARPALPQWEEVFQAIFASWQVR